MGQEPDQVKLEEAKAALGAKLDVYEQILSKQKYLAGDVCTYVRPIHISVLKSLSFLVGDHTCRLGTFGARRNLP
jgi:glutathione S-transferase